MSSISLLIYIGWKWSSIYLTNFWKYKNQQPNWPNPKIEEAFILIKLTIINFKYIDYANSERKLVKIITKYRSSHERKTLNSVNEPYVCMYVWDDHMRMNTRKMFLDMCFLQIQ